MRQVLLRVPDDLHARLAARARRCGSSVNAVATELLDLGIADDPGDARAALRAKARRLGVLADSSAPILDEQARRRVVNATRGIGPVIDDIFADGR